RMNRWLFRAGATGFILGGAYEYDRYRYGSGLFRTIRTLGVGLIVTLDYKINFREGSSQQELDRIHDRCANLILDTCRKNGGLYIKFGQAIAMQSAVMPPQYAIFRQLYDDAPAVPFKDIEQVFSEDFGCHPDALFDDFERVPIASASIAQVHCAKIKGTNEKVAVKVQKLAIRKQLEWDLMAQEWTSRALSWAFDLPLAWSTEFTSQRLREEVDFIKEGRNSVEAARGIAAESRLRYRAYVPQVHWQLTAPRVLTAEFIDGVRLTDPEGIDRAGFSKAEIMETLVDVFAHQIFVGGTVHCDPHPGNVIVRVNPKQAPLLDRLFGTLLTPFAWLGLASNRLSDIQLVILDHGLYLHCSDSFRRQYAHLWRAMFTRDMTTLEHICKSWGIEDYTLFASATLMRPFTNSPREADRVSAPLHERVSGGIRMPTYVKTEEDVYAMHMRTKQRARKFLEHSERIPPEIVFIGRNMNIIRALNKMMGSPVNRIRIMGDWAVRAI
ncbi:ABC1-domain-containing protein, partial [Ramicandelaber brevisporus]